MSVKGCRAPFVAEPHTSSGTPLKVGLSWMGPRLKHIGPVGIRTKRGRACHLNEPQTCKAEVWRRSPASQPYVAGALGLVEGAVACDDLRTVLHRAHASNLFIPTTALWAALKPHLLLGQARFGSRNPSEVSPSVRIGDLYAWTLPSRRSHQHQDPRAERENDPSNHPKHLPSPVDWGIVVGRAKADPPLDDEATHAGWLSAFSVST